MQHSMKRFITIKQQVRIIVPVYTPCMECCGHAEIVYPFQLIKKKVMKGKIKESPWHSQKIVFGTTVS